LTTGAEGTGAEGTEGTTAEGTGAEGEALILNVRFMVVVTTAFSGISGQFFSIKL
jgi:hypothetical protein